MSSFEETSVITELYTFDPFHRCLPQLPALIYGQKSMSYKTMMRLPRSQLIRIFESGFLRTVQANTFLSLTRRLDER